MKSFEYISISFQTKAQNYIWTCCVLVLNARLASYFPHPAATFPKDQSTEASGYMSQEDQSCYLTTKHASRDYCPNSVFLTSPELHIVVCVCVVCAAVFRYCQGSIGPVHRNQRYSFDPQRLCVFVCVCGCRVFSSTPAKLLK